MAEKKRRSRRNEKAEKTVNEELETMTPETQPENAAQTPEENNDTPGAAAEQPQQEGAEAAPEDEKTETTEETSEPNEQEAALKEALAKQEEYLTLAQRIQADFENFRRRNRNVRAEAFDEGAAAFATTLLPVLDNLERAIAAAENTSDESLKVGVEMVYRQLCDCFTKRGITVVDRKGEPFDPKLENAVMQGTEEDGEPGTVCEVFQKGYMLGESVLRHAMVKVVPQ